MKKTLLLLGAMLMATQARSDSTFVDTSGLAADTSVPADSPLIDTLLYQRGQVLRPYRPVTDPEDLEKRLSQNPTAALLKSVFVPGLGQLGNRRYIKAAIFMGIDAWFVGSALHYGRQASDFRRQFERSTDLTARNEYYNLYQDRKDERNKFTWFAAIITFISMFDAYVDAHLSGFPRTGDEDKVSLHFRPSHDPMMAAYVSISF